MVAAVQSGPPSGPAEDVPVPPLRQDIELLEGRPQHSGEPTWMLFDPLRNQYFRLSRANFIFLSFWGHKTVEKVRAYSQARLKRPVGEDEVGELLKFLFANQLTDQPVQTGYRHFFDKATAGDKGWFGKALHGYLFFKMPLFRPARLLSLTWPFVGFLFTRSAAVLFTLLGVLGLYLVSRQWPAFQAQFVDLISFQGVLIYGASLVFVKICHEMGHAYMAHRYGLKVPIIGVAFLVLMPILYTDSSNAWRLNSRRERLMVDGAGIMAELFLASVATLLWVFLPDGSLRTVAFSVAAVSWVLSLLVNLNPLMRFDGYFILSDLMGFENLQSRGFALAKWKLREILFGLGLEPPEYLSPGLQRIVILHAWSTWIYRFFLFLGIALLIYTFFIKVLALFLFAVEILWFIALPIFREILKWWEMRAMIVHSRRSYVSLAVAVIGLVGFFAPLSTSVVIPAVLHAEQELDVYPPHHGQLAQLLVANGDVVTPGQRLAVINSPQLTLQINSTRKRIALLEARLARSGADVTELANRKVLESELAGEKGELDALVSRQEQLVIHAEMDGVVVDLKSNIHTGRHVGSRTLLLRVKSDGGVSVSGLAAERDLGRVDAGARGTFYADNLQLSAMPIILREISEAASAEFQFPSLASAYGGTVPEKMREGASGAPQIAGSYYGVKARLDGVSPPVLDQTQRGVIRLDASPKSLASSVFERVSAVLRRESGF